MDDTVPERRDTEIRALLAKNGIQNASSRDIEIYKAAAKSMHDALQRLPADFGWWIEPAQAFRIPWAGDN